MFPQSKDPGLPIMTEIASNPLKDSQSIMEAMCQYMDIGLFPRDQFTIHPDLFHLLYHNEYPPENIKLKIQISNFK
jgi:hypothetical protein